MYKVAILLRNHRSNLQRKIGVNESETQEYCDLCGEQRKGKYYSKGRNYQILSCDQCGLIWTNPLRYHSVAKTIEKPVISQYWGEDVYLSNADSQKKRLRKQLTMFLRLNKFDIYDWQSLRILEVGSGLGFFLDVCEEMDIEAEGCDISEKAITYANRKFNRVRLGTLDNYYKDESFDAVFALNLIEHLIHPKDFFIQTRRVLKRGGLLVIETPIQESLFYQLAKMVCWFSKNKLNFLGVDPGGHIYKFSKKTIEFICNNLGFRNLYEKNISSPFGEIWGKSSIASFDFRFIYRLSLPLMWLIAKITGQGNRLFVILQKL